MNNIFAGQARPSPNMMADHTDDQRWQSGMNANFNQNRNWAKPSATYQTALAPDEEAQFRAWVAAKKVPFNPNEPASDYDMRGFWKALQSGDPRATTGINPNDHKLHFGDAWKTPYHQSFSRESEYAQPTAPYWVGAQYLVTPEGRVVFDEKRSQQ